MFDLSLQAVQPRLNDRVLRLYRHLQLMSWFGRLGAALYGQRRCLQTLQAQPRENSHYLGIKAVPIAQIIGSEGRANDFDANFRPFSEHTRDRWVRVALARLQGVSLPPVQLVQTEEGYYVNDGHHRISVARALGEAYIEAEVVRY